MNTNNTILTILGMQNIAVVGMSPNNQRPSHRIGTYLLEQGYTVIPVNPGHDMILGLKSYPGLSDIPQPIDVVDVFRRGELCLPIAEEAVRIGAKALWLQEGVINEDAVKFATDHGLLAVQDRCILKEHIKLEK